MLIRESGSCAVLTEVKRRFIPFIRAQNDFLRFADLLPAFNLEGGVVTAKESFEPGCSRRYDAMPLLFNPPSGFFPSFLCQAPVLAFLTSLLAVNSLAPIKTQVPVLI